MYTSNDLKPLFENWAAIMQKNKDHLIELDSVVGDGDLGLTMSDGFSAAYDEVKDADIADIGKFFYQAGKKMSTAVPSTMGTLMASGLMQIGKAFKGKEAIEATDFPAVFQAYFDGVQARGKAQIGDKTFLDGLDPAIKVLQEEMEAGKDKKIAAHNAYEAAKQGVENTTTMLAVHGRAATRGEKSRELLDPGAYVAALLMEGFDQFMNT